MKLLKGSRQLAATSLAVLVVLLISLPWALGDTSPPLEAWSRTFGGSKDDIGRYVQVTGDNGYIITGETFSSGIGGLDVYLVKTDSDGNLIWETTFGGTGNENGNSIQVTGDGGYIITGDSSSFGAPGSDVYLVKTDSDGNLLWETTFGGTSIDYGLSVQVADDGGYIITGETSFPRASGVDVYLVKTDSGGNLVWEKTFGGNGDDRGSSVQVIGDGGYIITGTTSSSGAGGNDVYLITTDSDGNLLWETTFGGNGDDRGYSVQVTGDGGYIITGTTSSSGAGGADVYLVKVGSQGLVEETYSALVVDFEAPSEVYVGEVFTVEVTVSYEFTIPTEMSPGIYDVETETWMAEEYETLVGEGIQTYSFELTAPEEATTWSLEADVWYNVEDEWAQNEQGSWEAFEVSVVEEGGGWEIPGFPYLSIAVGLIIVYLLHDRLHI